MSTRIVPGRRWSRMDSMVSDRAAAGTVRMTMLAWEAASGLRRPVALGSWEAAAWALVRSREPIRTRRPAWVKRRARPKPSAPVAPRIASLCFSAVGSGGWETNRGAGSPGCWVGTCADTFSFCWSAGGRDESRPGSLRGCATLAARGGSPTWGSGCGRGRPPHVGGCGEGGDIREGLGARCRLRYW